MRHWDFSGYTAALLQTCYFLTARKPGLNTRSGSWQNLRLNNLYYWKQKGRQHSKCTVSVLCCCFSPFSGSDPQPGELAGTFHSIRSVFPNVLLTQPPGTACSRHGGWCALLCKLLSLRSLSPKYMISEPSQTIMFQEEGEKKKDLMGLDLLLEMEPR